MKKGQALVAKKDYSRAILEFRGAAAALPKDAEPHYQLGLAYLAASNYLSAVGEFKTAVKLNPSHQGANVQLAELMTATRDPTMVGEAREKLQGVLKESPDDTEAMDALARTELMLGKPEDAEHVLADALQKAPSHVQSAVAMAQIKLGQKDERGAEEVMRQVVAASPQSADAALAFGQLYVLLHRFDRAESEIRRALQLEPKNGLALMSLAALQISARQWADAEQTYKVVAALPDKKFKAAHAIFLFQIGQRDRSLTEFEKLVNQDPDDRDTRAKLLMAYVAMKKMAPARKVLTAALKRNPKDLDAQLQLSELDVRAGDTAAAEANLRKVLHFSPNSAQAHLALARVYRAHGLLHIERQELAEAVRLDKRMIAARVALATNLRESRSYALALETIDAAPQSYQRFRPVIVERNWILLALQRIPELKQGIANGLRGGRHPELVLQDALVKLLEKDYAGARAEADELLSQNPEDTGAARLMVQTYAAQKAGGKGIERLRLLAASRPKSAPLRHLLGEFYLAGGNRVAARLAFEAAIAASPGYVPAMLALADLEIQIHRLEPARALLGDVLRANPRNVTALLQSASVEQQLGNAPAAIAQYRTVLSVDQENLTAMNNLASIMVFDDADEALRLAQGAAALAPNDARVLNTLGLVYYRKGMYSAAIAPLRAAFDREPTPPHRFHLGLVYLKTGEAELGKKNVQLALQQDPTLTSTERAWY